MNLSELEATAGRLLDEQKRLQMIDAELAMLKQEITQDPMRIQKDRAFYALIGMNWTDPGHTNREADIMMESEGVTKTIEEVQSSVLAGFSSEELVVPLDPTPVMQDGKFVFRFRAGATFPKSVEELSVMLGIASPLAREDVTIYPDRIAVDETDEYFAKKKVGEAIESIRKTVRRRLSPKR